MNSRHTQIPYRRISAAQYMAAWRAVADLKIKTFNLPATFPEFLIPDEVAVFCWKYKGSSLKTAIRSARQKSFQPRIKKLENNGPDFWSFSLTVDGEGIPLAVRLVPHHNVHH